MATYIHLRILVIGSDRLNVRFRGRCERSMTVAVPFNHANTHSLTGGGLYWCRPQLLP